MTAAASVPVEVGAPVAKTSDRRPTAGEGVESHGRTELLTTFVKQMNRAGIFYCLLSGFQDYPELIGSDVDFMVRTADAAQVAPLLLAVARENNAQLVQAIRHETGAWYFVLAKPEGHTVAYLHPDCCTDYRREGRMWLAAEEVIEHRERYKEFFVPAIADEFAYYFTKKILKQRITAEQWQRIVSLYLSCRDECRARLRRFLTEATIAALEQALIKRNLGWMRFNLPALLSELRASIALEAWPARLRQGVREWRRRIERVVNPTGLCIEVCGGSGQQRTEFATALQQNLAAAFRRSMVVAEKESSRSLTCAVWEWIAKARSTLVIQERTKYERKWLTHSDICFVFPGANGGAATAKPCISLEGIRPMPQHVEDATRIVLEWMAARLRRRMKLNEPSVAAAASSDGAKGAV